MPEIDRILLVRYSSVTLDLTKIIKQSKWFWFRIFMSNLLINHQVTHSLPH